MNKREILSMILFLLGLSIMIMGSSDILSIVANGLNLVSNLNLPDIFLNTFGFRTLLVLAGGLLMMTGLFLFKKNDITV